MVTTELRFFWEGTLPDYFNRIIKQMDFTDEQPMTDYYLKMEASPNATVKWREPNLEIKALVNTLNENSLNLQAWEKNKIMEKQEKPSGDQWQNVNKHRYLLFWDSQFQKTNKSIEDNDELYCQIELSQIKFKEVDFHSLCLECGGQPFTEQPKLLIEGFSKLQSSVDEFTKKCRQGQQLSYASFLPEGANHFRL